jgi:hypothetical protein
MRFSLASAAASVLALASFASAASVITNPSPSKWWVADSQNVLEWDCQKSGLNKFTVLIKKDGMAAPLAVIAIQDNFVCSLLVTSNQVNVAPDTGYQLLFANIINNTDVYLTSDPFEVKALGSLYPSQQAAADSASVSRTAAAASASASAKGGAKSGAAMSATTSKLAALAGVFAAAVAMI